MLSDVLASVVAYKTDPVELRQAICSVKSSRLKTTVVVVDNSPDCELRPVVLESGGVYLFQGANCGFGAAHNRAIRQYASLSKYHLVLNPDVSFGANVLEELYTYAEARPDIALLMPKIVFPDGRDQGLCKLLPSPFDLMTRRFLGPFGPVLFRKRCGHYALAEREMSQPVEIPSLSGCFMFLRAQTLLDIGGFDERFFLYMEDVDLCRRVALKGKTVFFPHVIACHGYRKGSYHQWRLWAYHMHSAVQYFNKWGWLFDRDRRRRNQKALSSLPLRVANHGNQKSL